MNVHLNADTIGLFCMLLVCIAIMVGCYLLGRRDKQEFETPKPAAELPEADVNGYAVVEVMGHGYAEGEIEEVTVAGKRMLEVAVEYGDEYQRVPFDPPQIEYIAPGAVFRITPRDRKKCAEERGYVMLPNEMRWPASTYHPDGSPSGQDDDEDDGRPTPTAVSRVQSVPGKRGKVPSSIHEEPTTDGTEADDGSDQNETTMMSLPKGKAS